MLQGCSRDAPGIPEQVERRGSREFLVGRGRGVAPDDISGVMERRVKTGFISKYLGMLGDARGCSGMLLDSSVLPRVFQDDVGIVGHDRGAR